MKIRRNMAIAIAAIAFSTTSVFAQNLGDAQKAISAEQYQKAKSILRNLTVSQAGKDENYFYLGWVYLIQEYPDSAKVVFNQGIAVNAKSALNYAGLAAAAHVEKDPATARANFEKAMMFAGKDSKPYLYMGKGDLLPPVDYNGAVAALQKGKEINPKDAEISLALGDAYQSQLKTNPGLASSAYTSYSEALTLDPKLTAAQVAQGILVRYANNYDDSEKNFQKALTIDPDFGPAYREWAETDLRWAQNDLKMASVKVKEALDHYRKFLSLTDMSVESRLRYMAFLINAGDFKTLQTEAAALSQYSKSNLRVYRYLGYAAYENKDYPAGLTALNKFMGEAGDKRLIPADYLYLGRLQIASGNDSLGVQSLRKAYQMDSTKADVFKEIATSLYKKGKYLEAADAYRAYNERSRQATLNDHLTEGMSYYKAFTAQRSNKLSKPDTTYLIKADSAFSYVQHKASAPNALVAYYQARANDFREPSTNSTLGLAKPYYEQYIQLTLAKGPVKDADKDFLTEAYVYLGRYYEFKEKDGAKAEENFAKAKELEPNDPNVVYYYQKKAGGKK